ncbi:hypothetical protein J6590_078455 [Homalodisca vitripennis]|nr:hypothetical protein J6590_078455 [Homalodisca vitripennis]
MVQQVTNQNQYNLQYQREAVIKLPGMSSSGHCLLLFRKSPPQFPARHPAHQGISFFKLHIKHFCNKDQENILQPRAYFDKKTCVLPPLLIYFGI